MHDGAETQGIVEAFAEHDFLGMRLSGMFCASGCSSYYFLHIVIALSVCPFFQLYQRNRQQ